MWDEAEAGAEIELHWLQRGVLCEERHGCLQHPPRSHVIVDHEGHDVAEPVELAKPGAVHRNADYGEQGQGRRWGRWGCCIRCLVGFGS